MNQMNETFLTNLLSSISVSGYEEPVQEVVEAEMKNYADEIRRDEMQNLTCVLNPDSNVRIMLSAHADEIGLMISNIREDGRLQVIDRGGIVPATYPGRQVRIKTKNGEVYGVVEAYRSLFKDENLGTKQFLIDIGAKDKEGLHCAVRTALLLAGILGIVCAVAGVIFSPWLLDIMSVPEEVRAGSLIYCRIYFGGIWAMILYNMMAGVLRAFGDSKKPLYVLVVCSVVNIVADLILVGLLHTGVGGAAAATVLSQIVSVVLTAYFLVKSDFLEEKIGIRTMRICKEHMGMMINKGFPLALQSMLFPIANSIVQASINTMGTDSIAAWGICDKLDLLIWLIADSMGPVLTTYTAQNLGAGKAKRVKKGALIGTGLSVIAVGIISIVLYFGSGLIGPLFIDQKDVPTLIPLVIRYMQMMAPFFVFYAVAAALSGACSGLGETLVSMVTTLLTICLFRVVCILVVLPSFETMECIVWIYIGSWIVSGVTFTILYLAKVEKFYHKKSK